MKNNDPIVICSATRTPISNFMGHASSLTASQLGSVALKATIEQASIDPANIGQVLMGCVLPAGQGQAPARQACLGAGIPFSASAVTINKMCGSGLQAVILAHDTLLADTHHIILAGGMESMSNAPYLLTRARLGYRLGHGELKDHLFLDGLEDCYEPGKLMGSFAEDTVEKYGFSRKDQDQFATLSLQRAITATEKGYFAKEITPLTVKNKKEETIITDDENPNPAKLEKIPKLRPAFRQDGTVTAANSSSISDGAAALSLMRLSMADHRGLTPIATIHGHATHAQEPAWFTTAPQQAIQNLLAKIDWQLSDVDLFEINEAFAVVPMTAMHDLDIPHDKLNVHGGACALGHPIGSSGARILVTLIHALQHYQLKRGIAAICLGGGEAVAIAVEC